MTYHTTQLGLPGSLSVELRGETAILRLSRAKKRNAIDRAMAEGIDRFFSELPQDVRAVVIHGEGDHFSAGVDLSAHLRKRRILRIVRFPLHSSCS